MAHIVILGAGVGGMTMAYEMRESARAEDKVTVISNNSYFQFTPSNPWVAVNWRKRDDITIQAAPYLNKKNIDFIAVGAARVHPEKNQVELTDGKIVDYDFLVIATGPKLAFDEVPGLGPEGHTQSVCTVDHAVNAGRAWDEFVKNPGPIVVGAVQGASCYGPAYEFAMIMDTDLKKRKIRDRVPMTFVTAEPYIGHLGLGGVGDSKGMLESAMRDRHIKWICNAKVTKVEAGKMFVAEHNDKGEVIKEHELPFAYSMMLPAFKGIDAVFGVEGLTNPRGFITIDPFQRNAKFPNVYCGGRVRRHPAGRGHPGADRHAEDRLHDRVHGHRHGAQHPRRARRPRAHRESHLERHLPGRFRRHRRGLRGAAADSAAQRQLVQGRQVGAPGQGRVRKILHAQDEKRLHRAAVRKIRARPDGHQEAQIIASSWLLPQAPSGAFFVPAVRSRRL